MLLRLTQNIFCQNAPNNSLSVQICSGMVKKNAFLELSAQIQKKQLNSEQILKKNYFLQQPEIICIEDIVEIEQVSKYLLHVVTQHRTLKVSVILNFDKVENVINMEFVTITCFQMYKGVYYNLEIDFDFE